MREYKLKDPLHPEGGPTINVKNDDNCIFCKHCTDVFWDYTHLIYLICCDICDPVPKCLTCENFEDDMEEGDQN